jgi:hypothetical protein
MTGRVEDQITDSAGQVTRYDYDPITAEANEIVLRGHGAQDYGNPHVEAVKIAALWSAAFGWDVKPWQTSLAMILLKITRECNRQKRDNLVDIAGYAEVCSRVTAAADALRAAEAANGPERNRIAEYERRLEQLYRDEG